METKNNKSIILSQHTSLANVTNQISITNKILSLIRTHTLFSDSNSNSKREIKLLLNWWNNLDNDWKKIISDNYFNSKEPSEIDLKIFLQVEELKLYPKTCPFIPSHARLYGIDPNSDEYRVIHLKNLEPLEIFNNLKTINIQECHLKSLKGIEKLKTLIKLYLYNNEVDDISFLNNHPSLQIIFLDYNKINEFPRIEIPNLQTLSLKNNNIKSIQGNNDTWRQKALGWL